MGKCSLVLFPASKNIMALKTFLLGPHLVVLLQHYGLADSRVTRATPNGIGGYVVPEIKFRVFPLLELCTWTLFQIFLSEIERKMGVGPRGEHITFVISMGFDIYVWEKRAGLLSSSPLHKARLLGDE